jgi:hypothetical protein
MLHTYRQVRALVELGADVNAFVEDGVGTPLHAAALFGRAATVRTLVQLGATLGVRAKQLATPTRRGERPEVCWPALGRFGRQPPPCLSYRPVGSGGNNQRLW